MRLSGCAFWGGMRKFLRTIRLSVINTWDTFCESIILELQTISLSKSTKDFSGDIWRTIGDGAGNRVISFLKASLSWFGRGDKRLGIKGSAGIICELAIKLFKLFIKWVFWAISHRNSRRWKPSSRNEVNRDYTVKETSLRSSVKNLKKTSEFDKKRFKETLVEKDAIFCQKHKLFYITRRYEIHW